MFIYEFEIKLTKDYSLCSLKSHCMILHTTVWTCLTIIIFQTSNLLLAELNSVCSVIVILILTQLFRNDDELKQLLWKII